MKSQPPPAATPTGNADRAAAHHRAAYISAPLRTQTAYGILSVTGCRSVAVDGGTDYLRRITGDTSASYTELSEYEGEPIHTSGAQDGAG